MVANPATYLVIVLINVPQAFETAGYQPFEFEIDERDGSHMSKDCPKSLTEAYLAALTCHRCQKTGHFSADCREKAKFNCSNCGKEGHKKSECPVRLLIVERLNRILRTWISFTAMNVMRGVTLVETARIENAVTARERATILVIVLYSSSQYWYLLF